MKKALLQDITIFICQEKQWFDEIRNLEIRDLCVCVF